MFCTRCGANNLDTDQFCRSCNAPLVRPGAAQEQFPSSGSAQQAYPYSASVPDQQQQPPEGYNPYPQYQAYPPQQYGYANQMSGQQSGASGRAIAALILSIVAIVSCCFGWPFGIVGIVLGKMEMNAIQEGRAPQSGETFAKVGFYLGIAATVISLLLTAIYFFGVFASMFVPNYQS
ncbi:MAG TPA: DUF4190 domain-containing protein [Blastocatellia bacterium]|nr:DUF4190 domain-containing protein [Blastocatellia bacterium]